MTTTSREPNSSVEPSSDVMARGGLTDSGSIAVPWGVDGSLELRLPSTGGFAGADVEVVWPELGGPLADYPAELDAALESPLGSLRLEDQAVAGSRVAIVVDDPSRWTPIREALPIVLARLHAAGVRAEDVTISVGVGRHHAVEPGGDAPAGRRHGRGRLSLLQPAGGRSLRLRRPGHGRPRAFRCGCSGRSRRPTFGS